MAKWQRERPRRLTEFNNLRATARALVETLDVMRETARKGLQGTRWDHALHVIADGVDVVPGPPCWCAVCCTARRAAMPDPAVRALLEDER